MSSSLKELFPLLVKQIVCLLLALFFWLLSANPMNLMLPRVRRLTLLQTGVVVILDILTLKHLIFLST